MLKSIHKRRLKRILKRIYSIDPSKEGNDFYSSHDERERAYNRRNDLVKHAVSIAIRAGYHAGYAVHTPLKDIVSGEWDIEWCVIAHIEIPTGQIRWHLDGRGIKYDGHTDAVKWDRIHDFLEGRKR